MRAVDTNIIIRLIMKDDPEQFAVAAALFAEGFVIPTTVLMESGWVLRSRYRMPRGEIADQLLTLVDTQGVIVADEALIRWALETYRNEGDLGDLLHVTASKGADGLLTFDRRFASRCAGAPMPVELAT